MKKILLLDETDINEIYCFLKILRSKNHDINNKLLDSKIKDIESVTSWRSINSSTSHNTDQ